MSKKILGLLLLLIVSSNSIAYSQINSFSKAKSQNKKLYSAYLEPKTFYCECPIVSIGKKWIPDLNACGYKVRKLKQRANRIEWEHVVSAWEMGHQLGCWQKGGRKNCRKNDFKFKLMEADMHNLVPSIGEVNADRDNFRFSYLNDDAKFGYGKCRVIIDKKARKVSPPVYTRGPIARTYLYMQKQYGLNISSSQLQLFNVWNKAYPVTAAECLREQKIALKMGVINHFVHDKCNTKSKG